MSEPRRFPQKEYLIGTSYFSGWWEGEGSKWFTKGVDWRLRYPERIPLLGQTNSQETMDREIAAASEHGVDFFQILWYPCHNPAVDVPHIKHVNEGVKFFMASPESEHMSFSIEYCNHPPFAVSVDAVWKEICAELVSYMKHPSYLRVGGKAMFKIHSIRQLLTDCGYSEDAKASTEKIVGWLRYLRESAAKEGIGELLLGAGTWGGDSFEGIGTLLAEFDYVQFYACIEDNLQDEDFAYEILTKYALDEAARVTNCVPLPYLPYLMAGWNPKPWIPDSKRNYKLPNREEWKKALADMKEALDKHEKMRIPDGTEKGQKMLNIYCWNEYGEGGIVAPTEGDKFMKLEVIAELFN